MPRSKRPGRTRQATPGRATPKPPTPADADAADELRRSLTPETGPVMRRFVRRLLAAGVVEIRVPARPAVGRPERGAA